MQTGAKGHRGESSSSFRPQQPEQYDQVIANPGLTRVATLCQVNSPGVNVTEEGTRITDVWESRKTSE